MNTKLTLRLDRDVIQRAKRHSQETGRSVSRLVEDYFVAVTAPRTPQTRAESSPTVEKLKGALKGSPLAEADYRAHLEAKHR